MSENQENVRSRAARDLNKRVIDAIDRGERSPIEAHKAVRLSREQEQERQDTNAAKALSTGAYNPAFHPQFNPGVDDGNLGENVVVHSNVRPSREILLGARSALGTREQFQAAAQVEGHAETGEAGAIQSTKPSSTSNDVTGDTGTSESAETIGGA